MLAEALCLLIVDQHGIKMVTPFTEQPLQALKWHKIAVYWSVSSHFCVDFKHGADNLHGRWIFSTLEVRFVLIKSFPPKKKKKNDLYCCRRTRSWTQRSGK